VPRHLSAVLHRVTGRTPGGRAGTGRRPIPWSPGPAAERVSRWAQGVPLRVRLLAILLALLTVALGVVGWGVQAALRDYLTERADRELTRTGYPVANLVLNWESEDWMFLNQPLPLTDYVVLIAFEGSEPRLMPRPGSAEEAEGFPEFPVLSQEQASERRGKPFDLRSVDGRHGWRAVVFPIVSDKSPGSVAVATPLEPIEAALSRLRVILLFLGLLATGTCAGLGWFAIRRSFAHLTAVERTAAAIAAGDLSRRVPEHPAGTEVGSLTSALNSMLTQVESAFRAREASEARTRRFASDASHELRTPLATIRGFAELYRQGAVPAEDVARTMRRIEEEAARMGGLVEDLLVLARLDEQRPARREPVDLAVLAGDAVHDAGGLDPGRPVRLTGLAPGTGPVPAWVTGDEDRLRQVVANLLSNALRHTPAGTPVEVGVGVETSSQGTATTMTAILEVRDEGPGLTEEQAGRVFERFYRVDASRRRGQGGGSGLGLSIVAAVVTAHGGRVTASSAPGRGATFRIELPGLSPPTTDTINELPGSFQVS